MPCTSSSCTVKCPPRVLINSSRVSASLTDDRPYYTGTSSVTATTSETKNISSGYTDFFKFQVQEKILGELREVEAHLACYQSEVVAHFLARGKVMRRAMKFPNVEDYARYIQEADESRFLSMKLLITTLRNACLSISHATNRNMEVLAGSTHTKPDLSGLY